MNTFNSYAEPIRKLLDQVVDSHDLHAKWLNTLSFLENCGARKIAACEHPTLVKEEMLKHAAEEFRHAYHLKRQIEKVTAGTLQDYSLPHLLGGMATLHYLTTLDVQTSRFLSKTIGLSGREVKAAAYALVTYAIELRAGELYELYDIVLREKGSKVTVKSIILEEREHLKEMHEAILAFPQGLMLAEKICAFEGKICRNWLLACS